MIEILEKSKTCQQSKLILKKGYDDAPLSVEIGAK